MCDRRVWGEPDGLRCIDNSGRDHTHQFESTTVSDGHDASEAMDE